MKRLNEAIASDEGGYNAVGFSYGGDDEYDPMNPTEDETGRNTSSGEGDGGPQWVLKGDGEELGWL